MQSGYFSTEQSGPSNPTGQSHLAGVTQAQHSQHVHCMCPGVPQWVVGRWVGQPLTCRAPCCRCHAGHSLVGMTSAIGCHPAGCCHGQLHLLLLGCLRTLVASCVSGERNRGLIEPVCCMLSKGVALQTGQIAPGPARP